MILLTNIKVANGRPNIYNNYKVLPSGSMRVISMKKHVIELAVISKWEEITSRK
jgi:hypothetical protein